jgi:hypothetical protein
VFVSVPVIVEPDPLVPPVTAPTAPVSVGTPQVYVVPAGTICDGLSSLIVTEKVPPLQIVVSCERILGVGFTGIVTVKLLPGQPSADLGVTVYVALFIKFVKFTNVPDILYEFVPVVPPVKVPPAVEGVSQLNVVFGGIVFPEEDGSILNGNPLQKIFDVKDCMIGVSYNVTSIGEGGGVEETVLKLLSVRIIILYEVVLEIKEGKI